MRAPAQGPVLAASSIERDDFMEEPPKKFFRLSPGNGVRLRYAYILKCESVVKDAEPARSSSCAARSTPNH